MTGSLETPLGPGAEFDRIRAMAARWGARARGLGDDCAFLEAGGERLAVSLDLSVEGVHFTREWLTPVEIGYRAAAAALSDLAAVAAEPFALLLAPRRARRRAGRDPRGPGRRRRGRGGRLRGDDRRRRPVARPAAS